MTRLKELFGSKEDLRRSDSGHSLDNNGQKSTAGATPAMNPTTDAKGFLAVPGILYLLSLLPSLLSLSALACNYASNYWNNGGKS